MASAPLRRAMTSPRLRPAFSAGDPAAMPTTTMAPAAEVIGEVHADHRMGNGLA